MTDKEIMFYVDLTFEEMFSLIELFISIKSDNIDETHELSTVFQFANDRLIMYMRALRDKLNEPKIL